MAKDAYYFSHDLNSRNDEKLLKIRTKFQNEKGFGIFWMIVECMAESTDGMIDGTAIAELSLSLSIDNATIKEFLDFAISINLFYNKNGRIGSKRIDQYKAFRAEKSASGKLGADKRWHSHSTPNAKESKVKESKVKNIKEIHADASFNKNCPRCFGKGIYKDGGFEFECDCGVKDGIHTAHPK